MCSGLVEEGRTALADGRHLLNIVLSCERHNLIRLLDLPRQSCAVAAAVYSRWSNHFPLVDPVLVLFGGVAFGGRLAKHEREGYRNTPSCSQHDWHRKQACQERSDHRSFPRS